MPDISKLQVYSIGIVAANKPLSSSVIEVIPIEDVPLLNGEVTDNVAAVGSAGQDTDGAAYQTQLVATASIKATWLPLQGSGNRLTPPDVRRGERVIIYRFADTDEYWWVTQGQDMRLRKLETVIWGISASKDEADGAAPDKMYWMEWSSHKKVIHLHTSKADGEPFAYDIQLNTKDGVLIIQDDDGQQLSLDSRERIWKLINRDGSKVEINKREITHSAPDRVRLQSKVIELVAEDHVLEHAPEMIKEGHVTLAGSQDTTGEVTAAGIALSTHLHREQGDGNLVSPPTAG